MGPTTLHGITTRHPEAFARCDNLREFAYSLDASKPGDGRLLQHVADKYPDYWDRMYRTFKAHGFMTKALAMPEARKARDVFASVSLYPRDGAGKTRNECSLAKAGAAFISTTRAKNFAFSDHLGASYGWSARFAPGEVRAILKTGNGMWLTGAVATPEALAALGAKHGSGDYDLATFEAVQWEDGRILLTARDHLGYGDTWVALLDPGETTLAMLSDHERGEIAAEEAAKAAAWGRE